MLEKLLDILVCPACLPGERPLTLEAAKAQDGDILEGRLVCPACGAGYLIEGGLAELLPPGSAKPPAQAKYDQWRTLGAYLWSHYSDLWNDPEASQAYGQWFKALELDGVRGLGLDAGCAVGRFTLEMAAELGFAVGVDLSRTFAATARLLARQGSLAFEAPGEGQLPVSYRVELPRRLTGLSVEFVLADAQALPFRQESFAAVATLNIVDKLPRPLEHLRQCQRVCARPGRLLFSDPFSWSESVAQPGDWLGGTKEKGPGLANVAGILGQNPGWRAEVKEPVWWTIRDHPNRFERMRAQVVLARREIQ
jgi:SAM-dependent methyltransferase